MGYSALHRLRRHSRRLAAATVAVFALNWLGLALMPCAMAFAVPAQAGHAVASAAGSHATADDAVPVGCPDHPVAAIHGVPSVDPAPEPCPWCVHDAAVAGGDHDETCAATPKPALDSRDAKNPVTPLLVALSAAVLDVVPLQAAAVAFAPADVVPPPAAPAVDRYCRRLE